MADCPQCGRPVAMVRPTCLYCGKPLPAELLASAEATAAGALQQLQEPLTGGHAPDPTPAQDAPERALIILDLREGAEEALSRALGLSGFEARQRLKRGGFQLQRVAPREEALREADRLAAAGVRVVTLPESDARIEPVVVTGGRLDPGRLLGRAASERFEWTADDLLLLVKGTIQRELQASDQDVRRLKSASPTEGYRFHLHRLSDKRPLELDPGAFDFEAERGLFASSLLRMTTWLEAFRPAPAVDDGFRYLPAALGASEAESEMARALGRVPDKKAAAVVLDNLRQFRFYSAWRGAVERSR